MDTHEHFPNLHALVGLVELHLIRLPSSPGARRVLVGIIVGLMEEVEPVTCVQPCFEVRRVEIDSMWPDDQLPVVDKEMGSESTHCCFPNATA